MINALLLQKLLCQVGILLHMLHHCRPSLDDPQALGTTPGGNLLSPVPLKYPAHGAWYQDGPTWTNILGGGKYGIQLSH